MREVSHHDLARHALGFAVTEEAHLVELRAARDPEIAAQLDVLRSVSGITPTDPVDVKQPIGRQLKPTRPPRSKWVRRIAAGLLLLWLSGGLAWAGWKLLSPVPLLEDDFETNWGNGQLWETPRRVVKVEGGHVRLFDRGYLVTRDEFNGPIDLRFRWRWIDLAGDFLYRDELTVVIRTSGIPMETRPWEAIDGIAIQLTTTNGRATITQLAPSIHEAAVIGGTPIGSVPLPAEQWFDVRITDDGQTVSVYLSGPGRSPNSHEVPLLQANVGSAPGPRRIAFYNRERLASASHESWIDDVVIWPLKP